MNNKKIFKNKTAKGLVSLIAIIILLSSILASTLYYQNNITANVIRETSIDSESKVIQIKEVNNIEELNQLNEGWYEIRQGYVFYLEHFDSAVPLYVKINNQKFWNGFLVVDADGNIEFKESFEKIAQKENTDENVEQKSVATTITGKVTGMEGVSGMQVAKVECFELFGDSAKPCPDEYKGVKVIKTNTDGTKIEEHYDDEGTNIFSKILSAPTATAQTNPTPQVPTDATYVWTNAQGGIETSKTKPVGIINYAIEYTEDGKSYRDDYQGDKITTSQKDASGRWVLVTTFAAQTSGPPKPPTLDVNNPQKFSEDMKKYVDDTTIYATVKKDETVATNLIAAANNWAKNPNDPKAKEKFDFESKKWKVYQETKTDNHYLVYYLQLNDPVYSSIAKELIVERRNDPNLINELNDAVSALGNPKITELNRLIQLEKQLSPLGAKVDFQTGQIVDDKGQKGWGLKADGTIDSSIKGPEVTKEQERKINEVINKALEQYKNEKDSESLTQKDGKIFDNFGREVNLVFDSQTGSWKITNRQSSQAFKNQQGTTLTKSEYSASTNGQLLSIYKDSTGKLYDYQGTPITSGEISQSVKFGDNKLEAKIFYQVNDKGQIDKEKPSSTTIAGKTVPTKNFAELKGFLAQAGQKPQVQGDFTESSPLVIKNERNEIIGSGYNFENKDGIAKGTSIESNFQNDRPLLLKTTSEDGTTAITEVKEFIARRDENGNIVRDEKGNEIKNQLQTKSWIKTEQADIQKDGRTITVLTLTTRRFDVDKKTKVQKEDQYSEFEVDSRTREPITTTINVGGEKYTIKYEQKEGTIVLDNNGNKLSDADIPKAAKDKINDNKGLHAQWSSQKFFSNLESVFTEFRGLGYYATLFWSEDKLLKWRDEVDKAFATAYLGTEYWSSSICSKYIDGAQEGIAYAETPQGLAQIGAHVEATRTKPISAAGANEFIYKITFSVRNGDFDKDLRAPEEMNINVVLKGERTVSVFKQDVNVKRGSVFGKAGKTAIVQDSTALYKQVCMKFDKIPLRWKLEKKNGNFELCNKIQESSEEPVKLATPSTTTQQRTAEIEINDF